MIGKIINNYEIDEIIAEGGMSVVYLGVHKHLKRKAAIKVLNPLLMKKPQLKERFKAEAEILSQLSHPNIVTLYDYIEEESGIFIITEFIKGETLDNYIDLISGPIPESKVNILMNQMLDAIDYLHSKDFIHRDIKPANFMITGDGILKLIDFGIAKSLVDQNITKTKDGTKVGTTFYMSPQQVKGRIVDRRTDIYSLGVTMFQMVTGQYPYDKDASEFEICNKIVNEPLPDAKTLYVGVSDKMQSIIDKATQKKPMERFQSCKEFATALQASKKQPDTKLNLNLQTRIIEAMNIDVPGKLLNRTFWQNLILILAGLLFLTAIGTGLYFFTNKDIRHILDDNQSLYAEPKFSAKVLENMDFGETVRVLNDNIKQDSSGIAWVKVYSTRGNSGYVLKNALAKSQIYRQINSFLANKYARQYIPFTYKRALREYFVDNKMISENTSRWKIYPEELKDYQNNYITFGDFDNNGIQDFACVIIQPDTKQSKFLLILDDFKTFISLDLHHDVKIRTIKKGASGGSWFVGNTTSVKSQNGKIFHTNKYEVLENDGILFFFPETEETFIYLYRQEEKMINGYLQAK